VKWGFVLVTVTLIGCATTTPDPAALTRQHERNVSLGQRLGYQVLTDDGQTQFCATHATTGTHVVPPCVSETQWMRQHPVAGGNPALSSGTVESGRSSAEGTLGY